MVTKAQEMISILDSKEEYKDSEMDRKKKKKKDEDDDEDDDDEKDEKRRSFGPLQLMIFSCLQQ